MTPPRINARDCQQAQRIGEPTNKLEEMLRDDPAFRRRTVDIFRDANAVMRRLKFEVVGDS